MLEELKKLSACPTALRWVAESGITDPIEAWDRCPDPSFLVWAVHKLKINDFALNDQFREWVCRQVWSNLTPEHHLAIESRHSLEPSLQATIGTINMWADPYERLVYNCVHAKHQILTIWDVVSIIPQADVLEKIRELYREPFVKRMLNLKEITFQERNGCIDVRVE